MSIPLLFPDWVEQAACIGADTTLFFPLTEKAADALAICRRCDVQVECLEEALTRTGGDFGIRGGTTQRQRQRILKQRRAAGMVPPIEHGTPAGHSAHRRCNQTPCDACRVAWNRWRNDWRNEQKVSV